MPLLFTSKAKKAAASPRIRFRLHKQGNDVVLAAADESALGKKHVGGGRVLDLIKYASFYGEETVDAKELEAHLEACTSANLVGDEAVGAAIKRGLASSASIVRIGSVAHLQLYRREP